MIIKHSIKKDFRNYETKGYLVNGTLYDDNDI